MLPERKPEEEFAMPSQEERDAPSPEELAMIASNAKKAAFAAVYAYVGHPIPDDFHTLDWSSVSLMYMDQMYIEGYNEYRNRPFDVNDTMSPMQKAFVRGMVTNPWTYESYADDQRRIANSFRTYMNMIELH